MLVTRHHRLAAAKLLGWSHIEAVVPDGDERESRLWEIAENLHHSDLTTLERSEQVAEWIKLTGDKMRQLDAVSPAVGGRGKEGGRRAAAREIGVNEPGARRAEKIAALPPEANAQRPLCLQHSVHPAHQAELLPDRTRHEADLPEQQLRPAILNIPQRHP